MKSTFLRYFLCCAIVISILSFVLSSLVFSKEIFFQLLSLLFSLLFSSLLFFYDKAFVMSFFSLVFKGKGRANLKMAYAFIVILLVNYIASLVHVQIDLTTTKVNTLSSSSISFLKQLKTPIEVTAFVEDKTVRSHIDHFFDLYKGYTSLINFRIVDPRWSPGLVSEYSVTKVPSIVVRNGERLHIVEQIDEVRFSSALIALVQDPPRVALIDDLRSLSFESSPNGASQFFDRLNGSDLILSRMRALDLKEAKGIRLALILGLSRELRDEELEVLKGFLEAGNALFLTLNPYFEENIPPNVRSLLNLLSVDILEGVVIDKKNSVSGSNGFAPFVMAKVNDELTSSLEHQSLTTMFFPMAVGLKILAPEAKGLLFSSSFVDEQNGSYLEHQPKKYLQEKKSSVLKENGPFPFMITSSYKEGKAIIWASSSFLSNAYVPYSTNVSFALKAINDLTSMNNLISVDYLFQDKMVSIAGAKLDIVLYLMTICVPLLFLSVAFLLRFIRGKSD